MMMMLSLPLPTILSPTSRLSSHLPLTISSRTAGNGIGEVRNLGCFSSSSPVPKFRLGVGSVSGTAEHEISEESSVESQDLPKHVAVIIDGHSRWARSRGLTVQHGHEAGFMKIKDIASQCSNLGIKLLTYYIFSTENWNRPKDEVDFMMKILEDIVQSHVVELITRLDIRFSVIGDKSRVPESLQNAIASAEELSEANKGMHFIWALSYGGRNDIVEATKKIASKVEDGTLRAVDVDQTMFEQHLMTNIAEVPNPDLLIRMGNELRVSDFFLWQLAYTELYFADTFSPDFGEADLLEALASYQRRERRFGKRPGNSRRARK